LAPFYAQQETIDRAIDGVNQRSYFVIFNSNAPMLGLERSKLESWLPTAMPELEAANVQHMYEIGEDFRGFSVWASPDVVRQLVAHDFVKYVEEDQVMRIAAPFTARPDWGQLRSAQKGTRNLATVPANQYNGNYPNAGSPTETWDWTQGVKDGYKPINNGSRAKVWIVDTGVLPNHQELNGRVSTNQDYVGGGATDCSGHGTHCAGSASGLYRGVSSSDIGNVRVLNCQGSGTNANVVAGFNFVGNNMKANAANILSASLGGGASQASDDAINANNAKGVICVVAAGNSNANACNYSPARATGAITIGATQQNDAIATFSNWGSCVDVFSPGVSIHSSWYTSATTYNTISGTSMATPLVAGAIALYATIGGNLPTPAAVRTAIGNFGTRGVVTGLPANTPNILINSNWN